MLRLDGFSDTHRIHSVVCITRNRPKGTRTDYMNRPRAINSFILIHSGGIDFTVADGTTVRGLPHDLIYLPKGLNYVSIYREPMTEMSCVNFQMEDENGDAVFSRNIERISILDIPELESAFGEMFEYNPGQVLWRVSMLCSFLAVLNEKAIYAEDSFMRVVAPGMALLRAHFRENLPVSHYADVSMVCESYFRRAFRKAYGMSPVEYRNTLRLDYVEGLLRTGLYNVQEAVSQAGFESISLYYRLKRKREKND